MEYSDKMINHLLKILGGGTPPIKMRRSDLAEDTRKNALDDYGMRSTKPESGKVI